MSAGRQVLLWVYLYCCGSASSMQWMRHYLRWYSCRRRSRCCSPLNSGQSGGKRGHAYLAGWPKLRLQLRSAAGRRRRRSGGRPSPPTMRHHGTAGPGSSEGSLRKHVAVASSGTMLLFKNPMPTCLMEWWWTMLAPRLACWRCWKEDALAWACFSWWDKLLSAFIDEEDEELLLETGDDACWKIRCSISCSCCRALTNAAFSRLVCSAFKTFFWLDDMQCSQRTAPPFVLSCLQRQVKSVLHWVQVKGSLVMFFDSAAPVFPG